MEKINFEIFKFFVDDDHLVCSAELQHFTN